MSITLTVTDITVVNSTDGFMDFKPEDNGYTFGYSCLTPQGDAIDIKQYKVNLGDDYYMTCVSYLSNDQYHVDCPFGAVDRLPYIGESYTIPLSDIRPEPTTNRLIRIVPPEACCTNDPSSADNECYCYKDAKEECLTPAFYRNNPSIRR